MERRSFLKYGMLGAVGMQMSTYSYSHLLQPPSNTSTNFKQFSQLCKGQKRLLWLMPEPLQRCIAGYNQSVSALGYTGGRLSVYVTGNEQFCFYPMWQPIGTTGEKALIVPVFCQDKSGNWYKSAVLNQYELASIVEITNNKTLGFTPDYTNLLPVGITAGREGDAVLKTADGGFWKVKTTCKKDEITCVALFVRPDGAIRIAHELSPQKHLTERV